MVRSKQQVLTSFLSSSSAVDAKGQRASLEGFPPPKRLRRSVAGSSFGACPLCAVSFPLHLLENHASTCDGKSSSPKKESCKSRNDAAVVAEEPIPGLFLFEDFISPEEEEQILAELDGHDRDHRAEFLPWKPSTFNGRHLGKRWGVQCNLRNRKVSAAEHPLPHFLQTILLAKVEKLKPVMAAKCIPNEANAIDYRRKDQHYLVAHVDDRQLSKEPIANLSLAGDCYMTFRNVAPNRNTAVTSQKVLLKRRCLQILTGEARYDFSHGIDNEDLLSDRRVSITMRESPLTQTSSTTTTKEVARVEPAAAELWWKKMPAPPPPGRLLVDAIEPTSEPVPGLFVFEDFITESEEAAILQELDDPFSAHPWKGEQHTGTHREKRFGVDHDLWSQTVRPPKYEMPTFLQTLLMPKLARVAAMRGCIPNDANAIDYRRKFGHFLKAHVDDRKKHKEPIANLSLAGDCYMTFCNVAPNRNLAVSAPQKVLLPRRCLQVMTGKARYDFSHGIENADLLSDRRVSLTMRETPI